MPHFGPETVSRFAPKYYKQDQRNTYIVQKSSDVPVPITRPIITQWYGLDAVTTANGIGTTQHRALQNTYATDITLGALPTTSSDRFRIVAVANTSLNLIFPEDVSGKFQILMLQSSTTATAITSPAPTASGNVSFGPALTRMTPAAFVSTQYSGPTSATTQVHMNTMQITVSKASTPGGNKITWAWAGANHFGGTEYVSISVCEMNTNFTNGTGGI